MHRAVLVGDLNIAPLATDVWNQRALLKVVTHTPGEIAALTSLQAAHRWIDAVRRFIHRRSACSPGGAISAATGRRATEAAASTTSGSRRAGRSPARGAGARAARGWPQPSDHVPVTIDLDENETWPLSAPADSRPAR